MREITLTAVLLVGGLSRRMGCDKATLGFEGQPLWSRQVALLQQLHPTTIWVSARTKPSWLTAEVEFIADAPPSRGPLSGVAAALDRLTSSHLLALAVDLPNMTANHLGKLTTTASVGCGVIPRNQDFFEPLAAIYPKAAALLAKGALSSKNVSMQSFATELLQQGLLREYVLSSEERSFYRNVNSREDLEP